MQKRYQIFVSSTYVDLKEERKAIIEAILNFRHIPAGMEMFTASNDEQFEYIKKIIDNCDYYVLIVGGRYGSINPKTCISYTEQEYNYAVEKGLPILAFLHEKPLDLPSEKRDDDNRKEFQSFLDKVRAGRLCKYWTNIDNLTSAVIISLNQIFTDCPREGWIRGAASSEDLLVQINDLRIEKETLEKRFEDLREKNTGLKVIDSIKLANLDEEFTISGIVYVYYSECDYELIDGHINITWADVFISIAPYLNSNMTYKLFREKLIESINSVQSGQVFMSINEHCIQTIKLQFVAYGFIKIINDDMLNNFEECLKITEKGFQFLLNNIVVQSKK